MAIKVLKPSREDLQLERKNLLAYLGVSLKEAYDLEDQWWIDTRHQDAVSRLKDIAFLMKE